MKIIIDIIESRYSETIEFMYSKDQELVSKWMRNHFNKDVSFTSNQAYNFETREILKERPTQEHDRIIIHEFDETGEVSSFTFGHFIWTKELQKTAESYSDNLITQFLSTSKNSILVGSSEEKNILLIKFITMGITWNDGDPFYVYPVNLNQDSKGILSSRHIGVIENKESIPIKDLLKGIIHNYYSLRDKFVVLRTPADLRILFTELKGIDPKTPNMEKELISKAIAHLEYNSTILFRNRDGRFQQLVDDKAEHCVSMEELFLENI